MRRTGFILALVFAGLTALGGIAFNLAAIAPAGGAEADKGVLADLISRALSSPGMQVSVGAVDGALSSNATIRNIVIADAQGPWLKLDQAHIQWTRAALLARRLEIDRLEIGKLEILRRPVASGAAAPSSGPLLPDLPVKVTIGRFELDQLSLGETIAGSAAQLSAEGKASLGNPAEGLDLMFDARRLDAPGSIAIRLDFVPKSTNLTLRLSAQEPAGGLLAHMAALPGLPPVALDLDGAGPLDHFAAKLGFSAGADIGADGTVNLTRDGTARRLALDLAARVAAFLPPGFAPLFAGTTELAGNIRLGDDGSVGFDSFALHARTARLDVSGGIGADRSLDLHVAAHALPAAQASPDGSAARQLDLDIAAKGTVTVPRLDARLAIADLSVPAGHFARFDATLRAVPSGRLLDAATRIDLNGEAKGSGLAFADPKWASAFGNSLTASLKGVSASNGDADVSAELDLAGAKLSYAGKIGPQSLDGKLDASMDDLSRFALMTGTKLRGRASLSADLDGVPKQKTIAAALVGTVDNAATGIPFIDGLAGGHLSLTGKAAKTADGFAFTDVRLDGNHLTARLDGTTSARDSHLTGEMAFPDLKYADSRLKGRANLTAALSGPLDHPTATASVAIVEASALGRPIPQLTVETDLTDPFGALAAKATLDGVVGGKPARGDIALAAIPGGGWRLEPSQVTIGSAAFSGAGSLDKTMLASGHLSLAAGDLDDLSPFALRKLAGRIKADIDFDFPSGKQSFAIVATANNVKTGGQTLDRLDTKMRIGDVFGAPVADGTLAVDHLAVGGVVIPRLRAEAKDSPQGTVLNVDGEAQGFTLTGRATLSAGVAPRLDLRVLDARRGKSRIALAAPASLRIVAGGVATDDIALNVDNGRVDVKGKAGPTLDLTMALRNLPLALASLVQPKLDLTGTLDGEARIVGIASAPAGDWRMKISRLAFGQARAAGLPPLDVSATGRLAANTSSLDATLSAGAAGALHVAGSVPILATGRLDVSAKGTLDAALANNALAAGGRKVAGRVALDMRATGSLKAPQVSGSAVLSAASLSDPVLGIKLSDIAAEVTGHGNEITIARFSATTPNAGSLSASGEISLKPEAGFPGHLNIVGKHAQIAANDLVAATADLDLNLSGALAQKPRIDGSVTLQSMEISVPDRLPVTLRPLPGTEHIAPGATAALRLAAKKQSAVAARQAPAAFDPDLKIKVAAPNRIFVRGRGIDAEFGGELELAGSLGKPVADGAFDLRRGKLNLLAQRLDLSRGRLTFAGDLVPEIDFLAEAQASDVTAQVAVTGKASEPAFAITSTPSLPQDEVLSRLLFRKPAGGLSPVQAVQLAQIVAELSGSGAGLDVFEKMRKTLGVDSFDVGTDTTGKASVGASRYITDNVTVGVRSGTSPQSSAVTVGVDVTKRLRAQGQVGMDGSSSLGVGMEWEY